MYSALLLLVCLITTVSSAQSTGTLRLYRNGYADISQSWYSGIVQVYSGSSWGNICDDYSFGSDEADVICHQLGYTGASSYSNTGTLTIFGIDYSSTILNYVSCPSSSCLTITQCSFSTVISSLCSYTSLDATVSCYSTRIWDFPSPGDIRLTGGTYSNQGLLEVYCNGQWGTVCDDHFHNTQAQVACRQLGYNDYSAYDHLPINENIYQPIYLRYLFGCISSDSCFTECGSCPSSGISGCSHYDDMTLQCGYNPSHSKVYSTTLNTCFYYALNVNPATDPSPSTNTPDPPRTNPPSINAPNSDDPPNSPSFNSSSSDHSESGSWISDTIMIGIIIGSSIIFIIALTVIIATALICIIRVRKTRSASTRPPYTRVIAPPTTTDPLIVDEEITNSQQPDHLAEPTTVSPPYNDELQPLSA